MISMPEPRSGRRLAVPDEKLQCRSWPAFNSHQRTFRHARSILLTVTPFSIRVLTLLLMSWANIYCCCGASAGNRTEPDQRTTQRRTPHCCPGNQTEEEQQSEHRLPNPRKCDECRFFAIRQNTLVEATHRDVPAPTLCLISEPLTLSPITWPRNETVRARSDSIKIPTALLDLNTCLLR